MAGFTFFDGVPTRISYVNSRIAVTKVTGRDHDLTREFLRLESHFLFTHHFCRVARGNEKGHVESLVGFGRRNFLVPVTHQGSTRSPIDVRFVSKPNKEITGSFFEIGNMF